MLLVAERPEAEEFEEDVVVPVDEHLLGFFRRPARSEALRAVGDPENDEALHGGVAVEDGLVDFVEAVDVGVMRVAILGRVLIEIDAGKAGENEGAGVGVEFGVFVGGDFAEGAKGGDERIDGGEKESHASRLLHLGLLAAARARRMGPPPSPCRTDYKSSGLPFWERDSPGARDWG
jgi:hypothetical protein